MGLCPSHRKRGVFDCGLWLLLRMVLDFPLSLLSFVCRLYCCLFRLLLSLSLIVYCCLVFVVVFVMLSSRTIRARLLQLDGGDTVACSRVDGGAGLFWSLWDSGLLGASVAPQPFTAALFRRFISLSIFATFTFTCMFKSLLL